MSGRDALGVLLTICIAGTSLSEEAFQNANALVIQHAAGDFSAMIQVRRLQQNSQGAILKGFRPKSIFAVGFEVGLAADLDRQHRANLLPGCRLFSCLT